MAVATEGRDKRKLRRSQVAGDVVDYKIVSYSKFRSRSHHAVIRVYDNAGNVIETHEHAGDFKGW
jgi:hypothetical protein